MLDKRASLRMAVRQYLVDAIGKDILEESVGILSVVLLGFEIGRRSEGTCSMSDGARHRCRVMMRIRIVEFH